MKSILITGGAGYIGSHTIIEASDYEIISIDNFCNSSPSKFDWIERLTGRKIINYNIDLCDRKEVAKVFNRHNIDVIIHLAAIKSVPESLKEPLLYYYNNINSLINILTFNVPVIFSSSCAVYGNIESLPVNEETPLGKPQSVYAHTKQICESIIQDSKVKSVILRYFNPVGGADHSDNLFTRIKDGFEVYGNDYHTRDGSCIRDYVHVKDIAVAHLKAIDYLFYTKNDVFNLGREEGVSVFEVIKAFEEAGRKIEYKISPRRAGDIEAIYSDSSKAKKLLNWEAALGLEKMISSYL